jgi:hypothetical protein
MALLRSILHDLALVCLVAAGALACAVMWKALGIESNMNAALATINQGCAPGPCGTLAAFTKVVTKAGDATVTTQIQEQAIGKQVSATMTALQTIPAHVNGTMDGLSGTAQTASTSLQAITDGLTPVLDSTKSTVDDVGAAVGSVGTAAKGLLPLESDTDTAVRGLLPLEANGQTISNAFVTTIGTTNHMLFTFDAVETKAMHGYLYPPRGAAAIWPTVRPFLVPAAQVGGAVAISIH